MSSLDELLAAGSERRATRPYRLRPVTRASVGKAVLVAVVGAGVVWLPARTAGVLVSYPLIVGVLLAVLLTRLLVRATHGPPPLPPPGGVDLSAAIDAQRPFPGVTRWRGKLSWTHGDPEAFARTVQPGIVAIIDERLWRSHGVDRTRDPDRARQLLGDDLWAFVTTAVPRAPRPRDLSALLARVEALGTTGSTRQ